MLYLSKTGHLPSSASRLPCLHSPCHNRVTALGGWQQLRAVQPSAQDLSDHQNEARSLYSPCPVKRFCSGPSATHPTSASTYAGTGCRQLRKQGKPLFTCVKTQREILFLKKENQTFWFSSPFHKLKARISLAGRSKVTWLSLNKMKTYALKIRFFLCNRCYTGKNMPHGRKGVLKNSYQFCSGCSKILP